jgi:hypothetical protein
MSVNPYINLFFLYTISEKKEIIENDKKKELNNE